MPKENRKYGCRNWTFISDWHQASNVSLTVVRPTDGHTYFGRHHLHQSTKYMEAEHLGAGREQANILEGTVEDTPLYFAEKEIVAIEIEDAFVQGSTGIVYSHCEIYPNMGINTDVRAC